jgi:hypothetical protein
MLYALALGLALAQPAPVSEAPPDPDYVTANGLKVFDPGHRSTPEEVDSWTTATMDLLGPLEQLELLIRFQSAILIIYPDGALPPDGTPCGPPPEGFTLFGCTAVEQQIMIIAARPCWEGHTSAGIFAHEVCHVMGHDHSYAPCYRDNRWATIVEFKVCGG